MDDSKKIKVPSKHSEQMIRAEVDAMLGFGQLRVSLGHVMLLAEGKSPYIFGGEITELDIELAQRILKTAMAPADFNAALLAELDAAFRTIELIDRDDPADGGKEKKSDVRPFSPEWMSDVLRAACQAVPSIGLEDALWRIPMVLMMHLWLSEARANGTITRRPPDMKAAMAAYRKLLKKDTDNE